MEVRLVKMESLLSSLLPADVDCVWLPWLGVGRFTRVSRCVRSCGAGLDVESEADGGFAAL